MTSIKDLVDMAMDPSHDSAFEGITKHVLGHKRFDYKLQGFEDLAAQKFVTHSHLCNLTDGYAETKHLK